MAEAVQMSSKEADRYAVIAQVIERTMGQSDAALWLNISVRQVKRLVRAIRQDGAQGAVSKYCGVRARAICRLGASALQRLWSHPVRVKIVVAPFMQPMAEYGAA